MPQQVLIDADYAGFVRRVRPLTGIDLNGYKPEQMRRRLLSLALRHGAPTLTAFAELMARDEAALTAFKNFFTINVSEFLRDPSRWNDLTRHVLPGLLQESGRGALRIWSAGCSYGAEPYTLAMLLEEISPGKPHQITATDIDETILARAHRGAGYIEADLRHVDGVRRERFFLKDADGSYRVKDALKARVRFVRQDLLAEVPGSGLDLIVCRNVVIYFTDEAKQALYERMYGALRPGGVLFVGGTEIVAGAREVGLDPFLTSFYLKGSSMRTADGRPPPIWAGLRNLGRAS
jgi:chemotaxis protein methyltransferase CheR